MFSSFVAASRKQFLNETGRKKGSDSRLGLSVVNITDCAFLSPSSCSLSHTHTEIPSDTHCLISSNLRNPSGRILCPDSTAGSVRYHRKLDKMQTCFKHEQGEELKLHHSKMNLKHFHEHFSSNFLLICRSCVCSSMIVQKQQVSVHQADGVGAALNLHSASMLNSGVCVCVVQTAGWALTDCMLVDLVLLVLIV